MEISLLFISLGILVAILIGMAAGYSISQLRIEAEVERKALLRVKLQPSGSVAYQRYKNALR